MRMAGVRLAFWIAALLVPAAGLPVGAQENDWVTDYTWARSLAASTGRPLLVCVGGPGCVECLRLHATTFRDPSIAATIARNFVAVKLDAQKDARIVGALGVTSLPVVVLAAPDGIILHSLSGYVDAPAMTRHVELALTRLQQYRLGIRPGAEASARSTTAASGPQTSQSYYPPAAAAPFPPAYGYGSPYGGWPSSGAGTWSNSYLSSFPDYWGTQRRC